MFSSRTFTYTWQGRGLKWNQNCLDLLTLCVLPFYLHHMKFIFCAGVHTHLKTQQNIWCFGGGKFQTENVNQRFGIHCTTWLHPSHTTTRNVLSVWDTMTFCTPCRNSFKYTGMNKLHERHSPSSDPTDAPSHRRQDWKPLPFQLPAHTLMKRLK